MTDNEYEDMTVEQLEKHHDRTRRKAKRRPHWEKSANRMGKALVRKKRERIAELESQTDEMSSMGRHLARGLGENPDEADELRDELDEQRSDVAELVRTVPDAEVSEP